MKDFAGNEIDVPAVLKAIASIDWSRASGSVSRVRADSLEVGDEVLARVLRVDRVGPERDVRIEFRFGEFGPLEFVKIDPYVLVKVRTDEADPPATK
jgi:exosome complex RNA-binding protein Rrp4